MNNRTTEVPDGGFFSYAKLPHFCSAERIHGRWVKFASGYSSSDPDLIERRLVVVESVVSLLRSLWKLAKLHWPEIEFKSTYIKDSGFC